MTLARHLHTGTHHHSKLSASAILLDSLIVKLRSSWANLEANQPGYPNSGEGRMTSAYHSDPAGDLATATLDGNPDEARRARDHLDQLLVRIARDITDAHRIVCQWQPPNDAIRKHLTAEAAAHESDTWCTSCSRVGSLSPRRHNGGQLCRWCEDTARALNAQQPPVSLVEKHAQGRRITQADLERHKGR